MSINIGGISTIPWGGPEGVPGEQAPGGRNFFAARTRTPDEIGRGRGQVFTPPGLRYHSRDVFNSPRGLGVCPMLLGSLLPRFWLQSLWASRTFARSYGLPPSDTGKISSTSGDSGVPAPSPTSTASPQSQQFFSSLRTLCLSLLRLVLLVRLGLFVIESTPSMSEAQHMPTCVVC